MVCCDCFFMVTSYSVRWTAILLMSLEASATACLVARGVRPNALSAFLAASIRKRLQSDMSSIFFCVACFKTLFEIHIHNRNLIKYIKLYKL